MHCAQCCWATATIESTDLKLNTFTGLLRLHRVGGRAENGWYFSRDSFVYFGVTKECVWGVEPFGGFHVPLKMVNARHKKPFMRP